jgi:hypothetical protein
MNSLGQVTMIALATAAISLTTARGRIFAPFREWVASKSTWFGELVSCFYCTSHWLAIAFVAVYQPVLVQKWIILDLFVSVFVVVAIAALVSSVVIRLTSYGDERSRKAEEELNTLRSALASAREMIRSQQDQLKQLH